MLLVADVGNSQTVIGLYDNSTLTADWRIVTSNYRTGDELRILFQMLLQQEGVKPEDIKGCCVSSVVPQLNSALQQVCREGFGVEPLMVEPGIKTGLKLHTEKSARTESSMR